MNQDNFNEEYTTFFNIADNFIDEYKFSSIIESSGKQKKLRNQKW